MHPANSLDPNCTQISPVILLISQPHFDTSHLGTFASVLEYPPETTIVELHNNSGYLLSGTIDVKRVPALEDLACPCRSLPCLYIP